ncbi:hypothetical protein G6F40_011656 [Rhizopus arrhizus]|nr:hypothetical protein G6F40_011656 [Rhizopus arrhizus]
MSQFSSVEMCAGAGGQALGLEMAGFDHSALIEWEPPACATLRLNRPEWNIIEGDLREFDGRPYQGFDLLAGGVPCPPFSKAGKQLGSKDERDLFPEALRLVDECRPQAVMLENVLGLLDAVFDDYRNKVEKQLKKLGYVPGWRLLNASDYGVSQLRPRVVFVGIRKDLAGGFSWPEPLKTEPPTVGELLHDLMAVDGWRGVERWREQANAIAPTLVGGSKKHGGPDLGPTRAKRAWATLGVDGMGIWDDAPPRDFVGMPRLTTRMAARIQGFPDDWQFSGRKTAAYRQIGGLMSVPAEFSEARKAFHAKLLEATLTTNGAGVVSNADSSNTTSKAIAKGIADLLKAETIGERIAGQTSGNQFEGICAGFVRETFLKLGHLRPGIWDVHQGSGRNRLEIARYEQYAHLVALDRAAKADPELAAALGSDYTITPDIVVVRDTEDDSTINAPAFLVDDSVTTLASLRKKNGGLPLLHASISCKWTIRSDRAQNARSEALNLVRNRKGRLPHVMVVTAEPTPSRLASIALGTGDIDCVYHFALYELQATVEALGMSDAADMLAVMVDGKRLKDISDLPLDLAV